MINFKKFLIENKLEFNDSKDAYYYACRQNRRVPESEEYLLQSKDIRWCFAYARDIIKGKWKKFEPVLLESKNPVICYWYTHDIIKYRWLKAEEIICKNFHFVIEYCVYFNISIHSFQEELIQRNPFIIKDIDCLKQELQRKYQYLLTNSNLGIL